METTIVYWGFIGIMEKKMEATIESFTKQRVYVKYQGFLIIVT